MQLANQEVCAPVLVSPFTTVMGIAAKILRCVNIINLIWKINTVSPGDDLSRLKQNKFA